MEGAQLNACTCMTWNVLNAWMPGTSVYKTALTRADLAAAWISHFAPDILCLQEFDYYYRHDTGFLSALEQTYVEVKTCGELPGKSWNPILLRKGRWSVVSSGRRDFPANGFQAVETQNDRQDSYPAFACNESPHYHCPAESEATGSHFRSLSWACLCGSGGERLLVANTHFSLRQWCQQNEAAFVHETLTALGRDCDCPVLLCGDYNSGIGVGGAKRLLELGWLDAHEMAAVADNRASCHPTSGKGDAGERDEPPAEHYPYAIDHVFLYDTNHRLRIGEYRIVSEQALLPVSDHCPTVLHFFTEF